MLLLEHFKAPNIKVLNTYINYKHLEHAMISIYTFVKNLPTEQRREVFNHLKSVEDANGLPMVRYSYRELRNTVEFVRSHQGLGDASFNDFLMSYNPSERALIHSMIVAKTDEKRSQVERKAKNEAQKTRKACRAALSQAAPQELERYDNARAQQATVNKQTQIPSGCTRPLFGPPIQ